MTTLPTYNDKASVAKIALWLFLVCFLIYNLTLALPTYRGDTTPARLLPFTILSGDGIYFDRYADFLNDQYPDVMYAFRKFEGHTITFYPVLTGILATPLYLPIFIYANLTDQASAANMVQTYSIWMEKISASFFAALSVALLFYLLLQLSRSWKTALLFALIFAFASQTFSISSQLLWQHGLANLFLILSQIFLWHGLETETGNPRRRRLLSTSIFWAFLSFASRPNFLFFVLLILLVIYRSDKKNLLTYLFAFGSGLALILGYNLYFFHSPLGGYIHWAYAFNLGDFLNAFAGVLFSPGRGMLTYTPFFIISLISVFLYRRIKKSEIDKRFFVINWLHLVFTLVLGSSWLYWWGGYNFGDRYLTDGAAAAIILLFYFFQHNQSRILKYLTIFFIGYSFVIQIVGVFFYDVAEWDSYPVSVDNATERLWDFKDNPIIRNLLVGRSLTDLSRMWYVVRHPEARLLTKPYAFRERTCSLKKETDNYVFGTRILRLRLKNESSVDWVAVGKNTISLKQMFYTDSPTHGRESPLPSSSLPPVLKSGQTASVRVVIIPPHPKYKMVRIAPKQGQESWWHQNCQLIENL